MSFHHSPKIVTENLKVYLDISNPKSYPQSGTSIVDLSGNGYTGTIGGGASFDSSGVGSINLDGSDDYIVVGPVPLTGIQTSNTTWAVWVYPSSANGNIVSISSLSPQGGWNMPPIAASSQYFRGKIWSNNYLLSSSTFTLNKWYYVVLTYSYTNLTEKLYINGVLEDSDFANYASSTVDNYHFLGQQNPGADNTGMFTGKIGSFQIYTDKELTENEILTNYNAMKSKYGY